VVSSTPRPHFIPGKDPVPIVQEAGWAPGPVWTSGKSRPHRDSIPNSPARSQSLYQMSYPAHNNNSNNNNKLTNNTRYSLGRVLFFCQCHTNYRQYLRFSNTWNYKTRIVKFNFTPVITIGILLVIIRITSKDCTAIFHLHYVNSTI